MNPSKIDKIVKYRTADRVEHLSLEMAHQHLANNELVERLMNECHLPNRDRAQDLVNWLEGHRDVVECFFATTDAMKRKYKS